MLDAIPPTIRRSATSSPLASTAATSCKGALGVAAIAATVSPLALAAAGRAQAQTQRVASTSRRSPPASTRPITSPKGYDADILIRWGDPVLPGAPAFDPLKQTAAAQKQQFGYNNDFLGYLPMPGAAIRRSTACSSSITSTPTRS